MPSERAQTFGRPDLSCERQILFWGRQSILASEERGRGHFKGAPSTLERGAVTISVSAVGQSGRRVPPCHPLNLPMRRKLKVDILKKERR